MPGNTLAGITFAAPSGSTSVNINVDGAKKSLVPKKKKFNTIQVENDFKHILSDYCFDNNLRIGRFVEICIMAYITGSQVNLDEAR